MSKKKKMDVEELDLGDDLDLDELMSDLEDLDLELDVDDIDLGDEDESVEVTEETDDTEEGKNSPSKSLPSRKRNGVGLKSRRKRLLQPRHRIRPSPRLTWMTLRLCCFRQLGFRAKSFPCPPSGVRQSRWLWSS